MPVSVEIKDFIDCAIPTVFQKEWFGLAVMAQSMLDYNDVVERLFETEEGELYWEGYLVTLEEIVLALFEVGKQDSAISLLSWLQEADNLYLESKLSFSESQATLISEVDFQEQRPAATSKDSRDHFHFIFNFIGFSNIKKYPYPLTLHKK